ncbi:protein RADIALIS-like 4 [Nymphaea colorata]|nr:protein RADIALIS-like 4 [Nymphaea colorata]
MKKEESAPPYKYPSLPLSSSCKQSPLTGSHPLIVPSQAASALMASRSSSSSWNARQNKNFEQALAKYDQDTPDRWKNIATMVGDKTEEEVKRHYQVLMDDLRSIESGHVPFPNYTDRRSALSEEDQRLLMYLKLQRQ